MREGETAFSQSPDAFDDAGMTFIGRFETPWRERAQCSRNRMEALERRRSASILLSPPFDEAMAGLEAGSWIYLLSFFDGSSRNLALQKPRHADHPRGTFSLRSPVRPNPIGLHLAKIEDWIPSERRIIIDAIDVLDGTPLLDIKPYKAQIDQPETETPS